MTASEQDYTIYIPTRGRVDNQLSVTNLPENVHRRIMLVCPKGEVNSLRSNYPTVAVLGQPDSIASLSEKRHWIAELAKTSKVPFWFQMDDDLNFFVWTGEKHTRLVNDPAATKKFFLKTLPSLIRDYKVVGFGTKGFALPGGVKENYHLGFVFGMRTTTGLSKIVWERLELYEDIDYTLQLLKNGVKIAVTYDLVVEQRKSAADGGLAGERTDKLAEKCLKKLMDLHPGIVKQKEASGQHAQSNTRISWAKAAAIGGAAKRNTLY